MPTPPTLPLPPDQSGYQVQDGTTTIAVKLDGGGSRVRSDQLGAAFTITVQWTLNLKNFNYLRAFYRTAVNFGALPFFLDLMLDSGAMQTYLCRFLPGTFNLISQSGATWVQGATIEAMPDASLTPDDATILENGIDA